jgi:hypothetical protein
VAAAVVLLAAAILANSLTKPIGRDEQMYCTAGALLAQGRMIYRDFSYPSQLPCHPLLLAALYRTLGTTDYLLVGRLVSVLCDVGAIVLIVLIYRRAFGHDRSTGALFGLAGAALFLFNPLVDYAAGYAWNHDVVVLCCLLSFGLFVSTDFQRRSRYWRLGLIGALLTVATFMRVTTALVELVLLAAVVVAAGGPARNRVRAALPFVGAGLLISAWPLWVIARASEAFRLNLLRIPALYAAWLGEVGMTHSKPGLTLAALTTPGYLALIVAAAFLAWGHVRQTADPDTTSRRNGGVAVVLALAFLVIAYIPPTMWRQYLAVPVPFIVIAMAFPAARLWREGTTGARHNQRGRVRLLAVVATAVTVLANLVVLQRIPLLLDPGRWTTTQLQNTSADIAARVDGRGPVLTLGPLQALQGGCDIYPELACGSIVYRVADRLSERERHIARSVGPAGLGKLMTGRPPRAVLIGVEPPYFSFLEDPLREQTNDRWVRKTYDNGLRLYTPPANP